MIERLAQRTDHFLSPLQSAMSSRAASGASGAKIINMHTSGPVLSTTPLVGQLHTASPQQEFSFHDEASLSGGESACLRLGPMFERAASERPDNDSACFAASSSYASANGRAHHHHQQSAAPRGGRRDSSLICDRLDSASMWSSGDSAGDLRDQDQHDLARPCESSGASADQARPLSSASSVSLGATNQSTPEQPVDEWQRFYQQADTHEIDQYSSGSADGDSRHQQQLDSSSLRSTACDSFSAASERFVTAQQASESAPVATKQGPEQGPNSDPFGLQTEQQAQQQQRQQQEQHFNDDQPSYAYASNQQFVQQRDCVSRAEQAQEALEYVPISERDYYAGMQAAGNYIEPVTPHYGNTMDFSYNLMSADQHTQLYHKAAGYHQHQAYSCCQPCATSQEQCYAMPVDQFTVALDDAASLMDETRSEGERIYHLLEPQQSSYSTSEQQQQQQQQQQMHYAAHLESSATATSPDPASLAPQYQLLGDYEPPIYRQLGHAGYPASDYANQYGRQRDELPVVSKQYDPTIELNSCLRDHIWTETDDEQADAHLGHASEGPMPRPSSVATNLSESRRSTGCGPHTRSRTSRSVARAIPKASPSKSPVFEEDKCSLASASEARPVTRRPSGCSQATRIKLRAFLERRMELRTEACIVGGSRGSSSSSSRAGIPTVHHSISRQTPLMYREQAEQQHPRQHHHHYAASSNHSYEHECQASMASCSWAGTSAYWPTKCQAAQPVQPAQAGGATARVEVLEVIHHYPCMESLSAGASAATSKKASSLYSISASSASASIASDEEAQTGAPPGASPNHGSKSGAHRRSSSTSTTEREEEGVSARGGGGRASSHELQLFSRRRSRRTSATSTSVLVRNACYRSARRTRKGSSESNGNSNASSASPASSTSDRPPSFHDDQHRVVGVETRGSKRRKLQQQQSFRRSDSPPSLINYARLPASMAKDSD